MLGLEIERRERPSARIRSSTRSATAAFSARRPGVEPGPLAAHDMTEPGELARRDERQRLVGRLEDLTAFVEHVAPGGLVAGDARVQHEVVVPAGDRDRVELDRPELAQNLQHGVGASRERPRGREEVPRDEKPTRRLSSDLHRQDTSRVSVKRRRSGCYRTQLMRTRPERAFRTRWGQPCGGSNPLRRT